MVPKLLDVTISGGGGYYNLYDAPSGGTKLQSVTAASFEITTTDVAADDQRTYYVEEPAGQTATVGPTGPYSDGSAGWPFFNPDAIIEDKYQQDWTMQITTYSAITIQSIDFIFGYDPGLGGNDNLSITVLNSSGNAVIQKDVELSAIDFSTVGDPQLNTITVDITIENPGNYEISFKRD